MLDRLKQIPKKIAEIWKKYSAKQRAVIISTVAVVVLALIVLIVILNQTQFVKLYTFDDTASAKTAMAVLESNAIEHRLGTDDRTIEVNEKQKQDAVLALADSDVMSESEFTLADLLNTDLSTTTSDKQRNNHLYIQSKLTNWIKGMDGVNRAEVIYFPSDNSHSILKEQREIGVTVSININDNKFDKVNTPLSIATGVAYAVGNSTTDKIRVIDQHGRLLFGGESTDSESYGRNEALSYEKTVEKWYIDKLVELATINGYYNAQVSPNLDINMEKTSEMFTEYIATEGLQSAYDSYTKISSENQGPAGDIPGTDSNDEPDYYIETSGSGSSAYNEETYKFKPSERVTQTIRNSPFIVHENSSLAITLRKAVNITEEELEENGALENTTFERYAETHRDITRIDDQATLDDLKQLFSDASGIPVNSISIIAYTEPFYIPKDTGEGPNLSLILEILLAALIVGLLLFVVFRAMKPAEVVETEPELSVERLLATTRENQSLEDIEFGEKSETRKMIEKYIDENADAVAALLRNWLSDDGWN